MARHTRMAVLNKIYETGLVPVFYDADAEVAKKVIAAVADGGCPLVEFTNRGDLAWTVFVELEKFCAKERREVMLGVGSVVDPGTASLYINSGASFVVGPVLNAEVAKTCNRRKVPYAPGCGSASEISQAEELGCEIVKVFPGDSVGGANFVKSVKAPCPWTSIMPTGGVSPTKESLTTWFCAGITAAGIGSNLISKEQVKAKDWAGITAKVKEALALIKEVRAAKK